jgi:hypothetical protein
MINGNFTYRLDAVAEGKMNRILEKAAKASVIKYMLERNHLVRSTILISEFSANHSSIRADLVLASTRSLHGIEIKTDADSLQRVESQLEGYAKYFTHVTFAVGPRHAAKALEMLPTQVGLWIIKDHKIGMVRRATRTQLRKADLIKIMNVSELIPLLRNAGLASHSSSRNELAQLALRLSRKELMLAALNSIRSRYSEVSHNFLESFKSNGDKNELVKLSRHYETRKLEKMRVHQEKLIWDAWSCSSFVTKNFQQLPSQPTHHLSAVLPVLDYQKTTADACAS